MKGIFIFMFSLVYLYTFAQKEVSVQLENSNLHVTTFGKGEPLLIINGGPGMNSEGFSGLAKELGKNNLAIIYDQRGTGKSSIDKITAATITMDLMVADIEAIREYFKFETWSVLGHSFGGMLASYYVSKHPKRVNGLILSSSGGIDLTLLSTLDLTSQLNKTERDSLAYWNRKIARGDSSRNALFQRGKYLAHAYLYDDTYIDVVAERLTQGNSRINELLWENMRKMNFDCSGAIEKF